jgi:hypothetical protein
MHKLQTMNTQWGCLSLSIFHTQNIFIIPRCRFLLGKSIFMQLVKELLAFYVHLHMS